ncbi:hypothetical protein QBC38DRAFT_495086 [Podospora fimiseda]|uniref:RlpA-like protein double-psi beta-barrel domain-containing protein n=1 Tax=Podospora fimiseda TaxID=252190 RepID=A0AAN7BYW2_9PEZI|nr:hypothetical protein QBC38DRAFT_495086 [Podospora fimiseda]
MKFSITTTILALLITLTSALVVPVPATSDNNENDNDIKQTYRGHITYYDVGTGACSRGSSANIVALSAALMPAVDGGSMRGRQISIQGTNGNKVTATIRDKCSSYPKAGIDISKKVFKEIKGGDLGIGKTEVAWNII